MKHSGKLIHEIDQTLITFLTLCLKIYLPKWLLLNHHKDQQ